MFKQTIETKVIEIINTNSRFRNIDIIPSNRLDFIFTKYEIDSLDKLGVIMDLENEFGITISEEDIKKWTTVEDIINYVYNQTISRNAKIFENINRMTNGEEIIIDDNKFLVSIKEKLINIILSKIYPKPDVNNVIEIKGTDKIEDLMKKYNLQYVGVFTDCVSVFGVDLDIDETLTIDEIAQKIYKEVNKSSITNIEVGSGSGIFYDQNPPKYYYTPKAIVTTSANPFHYGHLDLYNKATQIFHDVKVVIAQNSDKSNNVNLKNHMDCYHIPYEIIKDQTIADYCKEHEITHIIRGIRNGVDAEYELKIDFINKEINPDVQTIFIPTDDTFANISSSTIRELLKYKKYDIAKKYMNEDAMKKWIEDNFKNN